MSPIIQECERLSLDYFILHTGQHFSYNMDRVFFKQLRLPGARYNLDVGSGSHGEQTGRMLIGIEKVLSEEEPDVVLVEGDTNTVLAGALAAYKLGVKVGHVEAGLRSYDRRMPEEINRVLTDHCSDYLFAPTEKSREILLGEGVAEKKIFVTGNTIVDAVQQNLEISEREIDVLTEYGLGRRGYFLVTVHRQENVDDEERFSSILRGLELVRERFDVPIVYPVHPRSRKRYELIGFKAIPDTGVVLYKHINQLAIAMIIDLEKFLRHPRSYRKSCEPHLPYFKKNEYFTSMLRKRIPLNSNNHGNT